MSLSITPLWVIKSATKVADLQRFSAVIDFLLHNLGLIAKSIVIAFAKEHISLGSS